MWTASFIPGYLWDNGSKNIKKLAQFENKIEAQNRFMQLLNLAIDTYKWQGLPETCDERFLEMMLLLNGWAAMVKDEMGLTNLGFMPMKWNIHGQPTTGTAFGFFGQARNVTCYVNGAPLDGVNAVFGRCNTLNYPIINEIRVCANRLADIRRSQEVIRKQLKSPFVVSCEETQVPTMEKIFNKTQENEIYIVGSNLLSRDAFQVIQTGVNGQNIAMLQEHYENIFNEFCRLIGIKSNANTDKKERMSTVEVTGEFAITNDYLDEGLHTRKEFAENCNKVFGTNITVDVNDSREYFTAQEIYQPDKQQEADKNEIQ